MNKNETYVIASPCEMKSMALLFDKVWFPHEDVGNFAHPRDTFMVFYRDPPPKKLTFFSKSEMFTYQELVIGKKRWINSYQCAHSLNWNLRFLSYIYRNQGFDVTHTFRFYDVEDKYKLKNNIEKHQSGIAYETTLEGIKIIDNDSLSWKQVMDFKEDIEATSKLRNLRLWAKDGLNATSMSHAQEIIGQKLEDYEWAIKKHGVKTGTGLFKQILDYRTIFSSIATGAVVKDLSGDGLLSLLSAGTDFASIASIWVVDRMIEKKDIELFSKSREVAILYDIKKKFGSHKKSHKKEESPFAKYVHSPEF